MVTRKYDNYSIKEVAGIIAGEIVSSGLSEGWVGTAKDVEDLKKILAPHAIGYVDDMRGAWKCITPKKYTHAIVDMGDRAYPDMTINLFSTEESRKEYMLDILKDNEIEIDDDATVDDIEYEFDYRIKEQDIDGNFYFITKSNIIERG